MAKLQNNGPTIEIAHLAAYAEDPRSYCHFKGVPRSQHNKTKQVKVKPLTLNSTATNALSIAILISLLISGLCLWILLG